jgi:hypothetical protein
VRGPQPGRIGGGSSFAELERRDAVATTTFDTCVVNGQLQHQAPLAAFEGRRVRVTLDEIGEPAPRAQPEGTASDESEPPEGMDVERDVYVKMPLPSQVLEDAVIVEGGPLNPSALP